MSLADRSTVRAALEAAGRQLPPQPPLPRFIHFISLQGDLPAGFDAAVRAARVRRGVTGWPDAAVGRRALREGRIVPGDLVAALQDGSGEILGLPVVSVGDRAVTTEDLRLVALAVEPVGIAPETLRDRLLSGALHAVDPDVTPDVGATLLRGRPADRVLGDLWRALLVALDLADGDPRDAADDDAELPKTSPAASRRVRTAEAAALASRVRAACGRTEPLAVAWGRFVGADLLATIHADLARRLARFTDEGVGSWRPSGRERGFWGWVRAEIAAGGSLPGDAEARRAVVELPGDPVTAVAVVLRALGVPADEAEACVSQEVQALPGWAAMAAWYGARPTDLAQHDRPLDLDGLVAARLALTLAVVGTAARAAGLDARRDALLRRLEEGPDEALVRFALADGSLPDDLAHDGQAMVDERLPPAAGRWSRLAHAMQVHRAAARRDRVTAAASRAWPLFRLAQGLALDGDAVRHLGPAGVARLAAGLDAFDIDTRGAVRLAALEGAWRDQVGAALVARGGFGGGPARERPMLQVVTCIDDREESLRRHLEELDPSVETFGTAGFFGVAMLYHPLGEDVASARCPVVVTPVHVVREELRPGVVRPAPTLATRLLGLVGVAVPPGVPTRLSFTARAPRPDKSREVPQEGLTDDEQIEAAHAALLGIGLVRPAPLVVILGHAGSSVNNPYAMSYGCGACAGNPGGPNGRLLAAMANRPVVRAGLAARGLVVPDDTWFVGAEHDTTIDEIRWFDLEDVPPTHEAALASARARLDAACGLSAVERCRRLPLAPLDPTPEVALRHVRRRALDPRQPRPELGHTGNALAVVGRRALTRGLFLDRRPFLVSYDATVDPDGSVLEATLMAAGPVGAQINLDYYFSTVDRDRLGGGHKGMQNLVAGVGVLQGAEGDLRTGLPWQMIEQHDPMRLLLVVEARLEHLGLVHGRRPILRDLLDGAWVHVIAVDPFDGRLHRFVPGTGFVAWSPPSRPMPVWPTSGEGTAGRRDPLPPALVGSVEVARGR